MAKLVTEYADTVAALEARIADLEYALEEVRDRITMVGYQIEKCDVRPTKRHLRLWSSNLLAARDTADAVKASRSSVPHRGIPA